MSKVQVRPGTMGMPFYAIAHDPASIRLRPAPTGFCHPITTRLF
jgi:hypothetical protein